MIANILFGVLTIVVSILPAGIAGYIAARGIRGFGPNAFNQATLVFSLVFAVTYVASAYAMLAWWLA